MKFNKLKSKRGETQLWAIIGAAILILIVVVLLSLWFKKGWDKGSGDIDQPLGDDDCDGIKNFMDDCNEIPAPQPCSTPINPNPSVDSGGCTDTQRATLDAAPGS